MGESLGILAEESSVEPAACGRALVAVWNLSQDGSIVYRGDSVDDRRRWSDLTVAGNAGH